MLTPPQLNLQTIRRWQRIVPDQAILVGWYIENLLSIMNFEKLPFCHRPTPATNLPGALSSRTDEETKTGA